MTDTTTSLTQKPSRQFAALADHASDRELAWNGAAEAEASADELLFVWGMLQTFGAPHGHSRHTSYAGTHRTLPERLAALLVTMSDDEGKLAGVTLQAFAAHLGTQRETVVAILRAFQRQGFVRLGYRQIEVVDMPALKEFADIWL
jgi:CRP-like cAMP-binding protein